MAQTSASPPALEAVEHCLADPREGLGCLDRLARGYLSAHSTGDALATLRREADADPRWRSVCQPLARAIGRETFAAQSSARDALEACDETCYAGCYQGVIARFVGVEASDGAAGAVPPRAVLIAKAVTTCDAGEATRARFRCLHGLGHGVMVLSGHRLRDALAICDALADEWGRRSCYGGVFMENIVSATPERRDVSRTDYHYPCAQLDDRYRAECYIVQTWRMSEMGLSTARLFEECRRARAQSLVCMQSIGRDLSNDVGSGDPGGVARKCEFGRDEEVRACVQGVVFALIDRTGDGTFALPFCTALRAEEDVRYCFGQTASYLRTTFARSPEDIKIECAARLGHPELCLEAAGP